MLRAQDTSDEELHQDEHAIKIKDFQSVSSNNTDKSSMRQSSPEDLFTVKEMRSLEENSRPSMVLKSHQPVQLPRRNSNVFFSSSQIANTRLRVCLFSLILFILILAKLKFVGVLSALIMGLFLRVCVTGCNGFLMECGPIEWMDLKLGGKNLCGLGIFPSPRLAAKRRMDKERMYQKICEQERQMEEGDRDESHIDQSSVGYVSMHIDRNALYQRYFFILVYLEHLFLLGLLCEPEFY
jgi:hypothetical protein